MLFKRYNNRVQCS